RSRSATMTAVWPRGLPAASTTYHLRTMLPLFAIKVDMVVSLLCWWYFLRSRKRRETEPFVIEGNLVFFPEIGYNALGEHHYLYHKRCAVVNNIFIYRGKCFQYRSFSLIFS